MLEHLGAFEAKQEVLALELPSLQDGVHALEGGYYAKLEKGKVVWLIDDRCDHMGGCLRPCGAGCYTHLTMPTNY
ncbi:hypothetical protein [Helicobacter felis]|uniref:hypothetical protein n=1 Tax=Helicobacter felis TaxID=214 RepID=UPI000CEE9D48|nr:hypothetical protein [Helicobacter felis]